jgi:MFS family permease
VFLLAQFFQVVQGYTPFQSGVRTLPWTAAPLVVAPIAGLVVDRVGARTLIVLGQVFLATALGWIASITTATTQYGDMVPAFVLAGVGMGLTFAPSASVVMGSASEADRGVASGTNNTIREVGVAMGVAVLASVFASAGSYESPTQYAAGLVPAVWTGAAIVAVGALIAFLLPGRSGSRV